MPRRAPPCRLPVAHLTEHEGEENPVESFPLQRPSPRPASRVGRWLCFLPPADARLFEHRTLAVEGDDLPGRFYRSRDGDSQAPGTTACIQYPHAGSEAETLDQKLGAREPSTSRFSKRKVSRGGVGMGADVAAEALRWPGRQPLSMRTALLFLHLVKARLCHCTGTRILRGLCPY